MEQHTESALILQKKDSMTCYKFSYKERIALFFYLTAINIVINLDHGTIPAASNEIKRDFNINETALGTFGSLVYLGNLIGAIMLATLIDIFDRKMLLCLSVFTNAFLLYMFTVTKNIGILFAIRILVGITQSYIAIYMPVWIDQFAPRSWKMYMMTIFNLSAQFGDMIGYVITMFIKHKLNVR